MTIVQVLNLGLDGFFRSLALVDPVQHDKSAAGKHVVDSIADNELPHGVSRQRLERVKSAAGVSSCVPLCWLFVSPPMWW